MSFLFFSFFFFLAGGPVVSPLMGHATPGLLDLCELRTAYCCAGWSFALLSRRAAVGRRSTREHQLKPATCLLNHGGHGRASSVFFREVRGEGEKGASCADRGHSDSGVLGVRYDVCCVRSFSYYCCRTYSSCCFWVWPCPRTVVMHITTSSIIYGGKYHCCT